MTARKVFLAIGECMIEISPGPEDSCRIGFAGDTLNTAWYARACLPEESWAIEYFTRLGTDPYSARMIDFLEMNGIGTRWIGRDPERRPGLYMIELQDGERSFTYWREQSAARRLADDEDQLRAAMDASDLIYFSGITLAILAPDRRAFMIEASAKARARGKVTAFDPNIRPALWENLDVMREVIMQAAAASSIVLPSFDDERKIFADADLAACAKRYIRAGAGEAVVKNGGGPVLVMANGVSQEISEIEMVAPIDTTGAGDSFNGSYFGRRMSGESPRDAALGAHRLASRVIRHRGALMPADKVAAGLGE